MIRGLAAAPDPDMEQAVEHEKKLRDMERTLAADQARRVPLIRNADPPRNVPRSCKPRLALLPGRPPHRLAGHLTPGQGVPRTPSAEFQPRARACPGPLGRGRTPARGVPGTPDPQRRPASKRAPDLGAASRPQDQGLQSETLRVTSCYAPREAL